MVEHTLILSTAKNDIPQPVTIDFVTDLINSGLTAIEYFGVKINDDAYYKEEAEHTVHHPLTLIEFFYDTSNKIEYDSLTPSEINSLIMDIVKKSVKPKVRSDQKKITIHL